MGPGGCYWAVWYRGPGLVRPVSSWQEDESCEVTFLGVSVGTKRCAFPRNLG